MSASVSFLIWMVPWPRRSIGARLLTFCNYCLRYGFNVVSSALVFYHTDPSVLEWASICTAHCPVWWSVEVSHGHCIRTNYNEISYSLVTKLNCSWHYSYYWCRSNTPFTKEELNSILKFGAEELFKEAEDEDDVQVRNFLHSVLWLCTV